MACGNAVVAATAGYLGVVFAVADPLEPRPAAHGGAWIPADGPNQRPVGWDRGVWIPAAWRWFFALRLVFGMWQRRCRCHRRLPEQRGACSVVGAEASRARRSEPRRLARNIFLHIVAVSMFIFKTLSDECASAASFSTGALRTGREIFSTVSLPLAVFYK